MTARAAFGAQTHRVDEGVEVVTRPADDRDAAVAILDRPWVADEGPIDARVTHLDGDAVALHERGLAFDARRTVVWDEDSVQVVSVAPATASVVALRTPVLVRERFGDLAGLQRIDYLCDGVWLASRYIHPPAEAGSSSEADHA